MVEDTIKEYEKVVSYHKERMVTLTKTGPNNEDNRKKIASHAAVVHAYQYSIDQLKKH